MIGECYLNFGAWFAKIVFFEKKKVMK